jgi:hypothetical protein
MITDYRALCAELVNALEGEIEMYETRCDDLIARARAALDEPEPKLETWEELAAWLRDHANNTSLAHRAARLTRAAELLESLDEPEPVEPTRRQLMMLADAMDMASLGDAAEYARAVLARWGRQ